MQIMINCDLQFFMLMCIVCKAITADDNWIYKSSVTVQQFVFQLFCSPSLNKMELIYSFYKLDHIIIVVTTSCFYNNMRIEYTSSSWSSSVVTRLITKFLRFNDDIVIIRYVLFLLQPFPTPSVLILFSLSAFNLLHVFFERSVV